jgi:PAS domain S-box-containing protein
MGSSENADAENRRLRRTMRDLVALSALPAVWFGLPLDGIARGLADVLLNLLSLDLVYIRMAPVTGNVTEVVRTKDRGKAVDLDEVRALIDEAVTSEAAARSVAAPSCFEPGTLHLAVTRFGIGNEQGVLVTGSRNAAFPTEQDRLLLGVGANQTAIVLQRRRAEDRTHEERQRLSVTLASIGDAVMTTDKDTRVTFLNPVAEALTGWTTAEAIGQPAAVVFKIINEATRLPAENPAILALEQGRVVELANHTLLVARDGTERPIEDSAAPLRDPTGANLGAVLVFRDVTEKKRAEAAQAQLAAIVRSSDDAIVSKTLDGVIRSWNTGAERLFGYTPEEAVGRHITLIIPPDRLDEETVILGRLRRGERIEHFETVRVAKDGRLIDISLTISPVRDKAGKIIGASKIARDITAAKRAEATLRESEGRHRFLALLANDIQTVTDPAEVMATTARLLADHLGVDRFAYAEVENQSVFVITGDYAKGVPSIVGRWPVAAFGAECERCMLANEPYVISDVDSDVRAGADLLAYRQTNIQAVICVPLHKAGKFVAAMAAHQITPRQWTPAEIELVRTVVGRSWESLERARVGRDLKEVADRLALAIAAARLGDWSWDATTDVVTLSARAAEIFGVAPGPRMTWTEMQELLHEGDREQARSKIERAIAARDQYDADYRVIRPNGAVVWVSAKGHAQYDPTGSPLGMFGVVQDITERKQLEEELIQRATELAEADRKKDDFIALLAHELRNPLAPVRTGLQVMRLAAGDATAVAKAQAMMDRQLSHMVRLIDDLLDVSRISRNKLNLQKRKVLLAEVVSHAIETVGPVMEAAGHQLTVSLPPEPIVLDVDLTRLAQVFGNLLTNSAKYTERGGRIWLTAAVIGAEVNVSVRDTGIGIPAEALPSVFDMFSQVDRSVERATGGLGIGLALVKGLVEAHGGVVAAESPGHGAGSTFTVRLPVAGTQADSLLEPTGDVRSSRGGNRVLVADDSADGLESMAELLALLGNEVHVAHDGIEAVAIAEAVRPNLVLMDIGMPRLGGLEATQQIRARPWGKGITIIALSGWGQDSDRQRSRAAGCDGHLVKPVDFSQMEKLLTELSQSTRIASASGE